MPSISSAIDETIAQLTSLHQTRRAFDNGIAKQLETVVAGLNVGSSPDDESQPERGGRPPEPLRRGTPSEPVPFVALPARTTHGGDFGPAVKSKLIAEAMAKGEW